MSKFNLFEASITLFLAFSLFYVNTRKVAIPQEQMFTVINGLATSISVVVGFSGAFMIFTISSAHGVLSDKNPRSPRPWIYLAGVCVPISMLWTVYVYVSDGSLSLALGVAISSLDVALYVLVDFIGYWIKQLLQARGEGNL